MINVLFGSSGYWRARIPGIIDRSRYSFAFPSFQRADLVQGDCVVPLNIPNYEPLWRRGVRGSSNYIIPSEGVARLCADKKLLDEAIRATPLKNLLPPGFEHERRKFPYVLKHRMSCAGKGVRIVRNEAEERRLARLLHDPNYMRQAYVPGSIELATHMLITGDKLSYQATRRYQMDGEYQVKGVARPLARDLVANIGDEIAGSFLQLLNFLGFEGTCCIDYKMVNGRVQILEINPRCGASLVWDLNRYLAALVGSLRERCTGAFGNSAVPAE